MPRRHALSFVLAIACAPPTRSPPATTPTERSPESPAPPRPLATSPEPTPAPADTAPPPQPRTPLATGFAQTLAVLQYPEAGGNVDDPAVVLFSDELLAIRRAVAAELTRRGTPMIPVADLERIESAGAQSQLALESDRTCAVPLTREDVHARYFPNHPRIQILASCVDGCHLGVDIEHPGGDPLVLRSPIVTHPERPSQWIAAARRLADDVALIGGLGLRGGGDPPPIDFAEPGVVGPWKRALTEGHFDPLEVGAASCANPDPAIAITWKLLATVDRAGRIDRCEAVAPTPAARAADGRCLCEQLHRLGFGSAPAGRRLRVEAIDAAPFIGSRIELAPLQPGTEPWVARVEATPALAHCAAPVGLRLPMAAIVSLALADDGRVDDVRVDGNITEPDTMRWAKCIVDELRTIALPCPPPGITTLQVELRVTP